MPLPYNALSKRSDKRKFKKPLVIGGKMVYNNRYDT